MCSDPAACTQTTHGCCDVLHVTEYSGTNGSLRRDAMNNSQFGRGRRSYKLGSKMNYRY